MQCHLELVKNNRKKLQFESDELNQLCPDGVVLSGTEKETINAMALVSDIPLILYGETGTGKELLAKQLHKKRCAHEGVLPFVAVNCSHLNGELATSLLFGHGKGAFSGAVKTTDGFISEAHGGILFLDEIHTLSIDCQHKLLRVLNDGSYQRVGETKTQQATFQSIVASTKNLDMLVEEGKILPDLRGRITGLEIRLRSLEERREDIPLFLSLVLEKRKVTLTDALFSELVRKCASITWPGNIRQMMRAVDTLISYAKVRNIPVLPDGLIRPDQQSAVVPPSLTHVHLVKTGDQTPMLPLGVLDMILAPLSKDSDFEAAVENYEKLVLQALLTRHKSTLDAARATGMSRSTLERKSRRYGIYPHVTKNFDDKPKV